LTNHFCTHLFGFYLAHLLICILFLCSDHEPIPDVEFHNPLYNDQSRSNTINLSPADDNHSINATTGACSLADDITSINNTSEIFINSENESDTERTELVSNFEHDLSSPEQVTSENDVIQSTVYIDCLTTLW
jgi:hypothetical protein